MVTQSTNVNGTIVNNVYKEAPIAEKATTNQGVVDARISGETLSVTPQVEEMRLMLQTNKDYGLGD